jgi:hypothetical protein
MKEGRENVSERDDPVKEDVLRRISEPRATTICTPPWSA